MASHDHTTFLCVLCHASFLCLARGMYVCSDVLKGEKGLFPTSAIMCPPHQVNPSGPRLLYYVGPLRKTVRTSRGRTAYRTFVAEVQVRPISRRRHAAGPQPARGASRSCQRVIRSQLLPGRSRCLFFLGAAHPATPLFLSTFHLPKKKAQF